MFNQLDGKSLPLSDAIPQANAGAGASGTANDIARSDHTHPLQVTTTTAEALGTTGADVTIGTAAPPTTGQILTATSATTATWQTFSGPTVLSGGTSIQSGTSGPGLGISGVVTFPVVFNTAPAVTVQSKTSSTTSPRMTYLTSVTTGGFAWYCFDHNGSGASADTLYWIAIGT
jgi:hypothetical protein